MFYVFLQILSKKFFFSKDKKNLTNYIRYARKDAYTISIIVSPIIYSQNSVSNFMNIFVIFSSFCIWTDGSRWRIVTSGTLNITSSWKRNSCHMLLWRPETAILSPDGYKQGAGQFLTTWKLFPIINFPHYLHFLLRWIMLFRLEIISSWFTQTAGPGTHYNMTNYL
jgi:hypothetical protein